MTSPGGEHVSRYKAVGEFDNLIRAAHEAKRALKELREEQAKLNAESIADDKKVTASKQDRTKAEIQSAEAAKKAATDLNKGDVTGKAGESAGTSYSKGVGRGIEKESKSPENQRFLKAATDALTQAFAKAGDDSGKSYSRNLNTRIATDTRSTETVLQDSIKKIQKSFADAGDESGRQFTVNIRERFRRDSKGAISNSGFEISLRELVNRAGQAGSDTGLQYVTGFGRAIKNLNDNLRLVGFDKLDLDVDIDDARQSIKALEIELTELSHRTAEPQVRIDTNRALANLRLIQRVFKDEVAEQMEKDAARIRKELEKLDTIPSGKSFKFWALTALSDMTKVFEEADRGTSVFDRLRKAASAGGGGGNFVKSFISGFDDFSESSSNLLQKLSRVSGELYRMPGLIAVFVAAIPALISGLGALAGGALSLASGLGAVGGAILALPGLGAAAIASVGALSSTFGGLSDVLKEAKKAQTEEAWAKEQARLGTDKALTSTQKYKLAIDNMLPATGKVTEAIVGFADAYTDVGDQIGENFFKQLVGDIDNLGKVLPIAEKFFGSAATALGKVANEGLKMITSGPFAKDFETIGKNNAVVIDNLGHAALSVVSAFRNIAIAAAPFTSWLTKGIRDAADAFDDWSATARDSGSIDAFLGETEESLHDVWVIIKNLGSIISSFFKTTVDEGQSYLRTLGEITKHWADVAKAQEAANSPLRQWVIQIRPILSSLGALIGDVVKGIAGLATNQNSVSSMINLLDTLRTDVLPPILAILQHLNDSGIAVTIVEALGSMLEAISKFLESGATQALSVFVTVLANFAELLFDIASLPGISDVLGALASGLATLAAVSIVARFTGLFKLWDFFNWMTRNRGNLSGAFADAARGVAGLSTTGQANIPKNVPSTISLGSNAIGSEVIANQAKAMERVGEAARTSATKVGFFSRALSGINSAGTLAKGAMSNLVGFLGGPWGIAITAATIGIGLLANHLSDQKKEAEDTKQAFISLKSAYTELRGGDTSGVLDLAETDDKLKSIIDSANKYKISLTDISGALNGQDQSLSRVNAQLDAQIAAYQRLADSDNATQLAAGNGVKFNGTQLVSATDFQDLANKAREYQKQINEVGNSQTGANAALNEAGALTRTYQERLGGLTQAQVDNNVLIGEYDKKIRTLSGALDTLSSSTSSNAEKSRAVGNLIEYETGAMVSATEATEAYNSSLITLSESAEANGKKIDTKTRASLRNRDALEDAAKATRDLYLQDIASGEPMDKATRKHEARIKRLKEEAEKTFENKKEVDKLIDTYGGIPPTIKTDIQNDEKGFAAVYADLLKLQTIQTALKEGKSVAEAEKEWRNKQNGLYQRPPSTGGDGYGLPGYATGGAVWGAGSKTSDSIQAWLSNGEFVQPADAVEHYGMNVMEALRSRKLDRATLEEALPDDSRSQYATGGSVHSDNCQSCAMGGHKFATGGSITVPIKVDPSKTLIKDSWKYNGTDGAALGGAGVGGAGWKWQMAVLRKAFPGLSLLSGPRPGARTLSGNRSYHAVGRAVDVPARRDVAAWINRNYGSKTKELITPWNDLNIHNGRRHTYTGDIYAQHAGTGRFKGNAHDHWAFRNGGLVDLMEMLNMSNLAPSQSTALPTTPRTLSPAASSVVNNNNNDNGTNFGDIIINNPVAERGGDSIRDSLFRTRYLLG